MQCAYTKKPSTQGQGFFLSFGGPERIRTAVQGFADLCLAARPQDHFVVGANI